MEAKLTLPPSQSHFLSFLVKLFPVKAGLPGLPNGAHSHDFRPAARTVGSSGPVRRLRLPNSGGLLPSVSLP